MKNLILATFIAFVVSACSTTVPVSHTVPVPAVLPPSPEPVAMPRLNFKVVNPDANTTLYALDYQNLEALMLGLNGAADYIEKKNAEVQFYKDFLQKVKEAQTATPTQ
jgi:hypothetical protein